MSAIIETKRIFSRELPLMALRSWGFRPIGLQRRPAYQKCQSRKTAMALNSQMRVKVLKAYHCTYAWYYTSAVIFRHSISSMRVCMNYVYIQWIIENVSTCLYTCTCPSHKFILSHAFKHVHEWIYIYIYIITSQINGNIIRHLVDTKRFMANV